MLEILEGYRQINSKFMADGILSPDAYAKSIIKIVWILKEPYGDLPPHYGDDIQERIDGKKKDSAHTWQRMALASYMILNGIKEIDQVPLWRIYGASLKELAIINIKKHSGASTTNMAKFSKFYKRYRKILGEIVNNQISDINPDIVIGGGTLQMIKDDLGERIELGRGHFKIGNRLFINTWHPSQRKLGLLNYSNLVAGRVAELFKHQ